MIVVVGHSWISQREASFVLQCGAGITERGARRVLADGLAGVPRRLAGVSLYEAERVEALAARRELDEAELDMACPNGLFVARRGAPLDRGWRFSPWTCVWIKSRVDRHGHLPMVVTLRGFVVAGAAITAARTDGTLSLAEPGGWFGSFRDRRLSTGPGRDWWIRGLDRPVNR